MIIVSFLFYIFTLKYIDELEFLKLI